MHFMCNHFVSTLKGGSNYTFYSVCCLCVVGSSFLTYFMGLIHIGVGSGGQGGRSSPWIFKHGTNIVNTGLKVLFFGPFFVAPLPLDEAK